MSNTPDEILTREIAKFAKSTNDRYGALAGAVGGALGSLPWSGAGLIGGAIGGAHSGNAAAAGAAWAAKRLGLNEFQGDVVTSLPLERALRECALVLEARGQLLVGDDAESTPLPTVRAIIHGGAMNMNPVFVAAQCQPACIENEGTTGARDHTLVHVYCAAKEGLVKQHAGQKTGELLLVELKKVLVSK